MGGASNVLDLWCIMENHIRPVNRTNTYTYVCVHMYTVYINACTDVCACTCVGIRVATLRGNVHGSGTLGTVF